MVANDVEQPILCFETKSDRRGPRHAAELWAFRSRQSRAEDASLDPIRLRTGNVVSGVSVQIN